jgi:hypothetical protein
VRDVALISVSPNPTGDAHLLGTKQDTEQSQLERKMDVINRQKPPPTEKFVFEHIRRRDLAEVRRLTSTKNAAYIAAPILLGSLFRERQLNQSKAAVTTMVT